MADKSNDDKIHLTDAPAVVSWLGQDGQVRYLHDAKAKSAVTFELYHDEPSKTAFFKLRASVSLKDFNKSKTRVFLYIHPERIASLALDQDDSAAPSLLDATTICLRFELARPAAFIVPQTNLAPANSSSGQILDSLRALASVINFAVHLPSTALTKSSLMLVCARASQHRLTTMAKHADVTGLYNGKGGMVWFASDAVNEHIATHSELSPPSYADVVPSQSSPSTPEGSAPPRKRRRTDSDVGESEADARNECMSSKAGHDGPELQQRNQASPEKVKQVIETLRLRLGCAQTMQPQFDELRSRMEKTEQIMVQLRNEVFDALKIRSTLPGLETRLEKTEEITQELEGEVAEVRDTVANREDLIDCQLDERFDAVKWDLENIINECVEEHVKEAVPQLVKDYLGNTTISLQINDG
ncbi:hypothetical protein F5X96DRAFT_663221 [Biscogniauxia mediterranea]|nr:hypothetical protein F5X96DRAFT_663221 [Biscogniauxia mediterranea]